jgi:hypothetical protein
LACILQILGDWLRHGRSMATRRGSRAGKE